MNRRVFVTGLGALLAAPLAAAAQVRKIPRVGMLFLATREGARPYITSFEGGMRTLGYVEGRNIVYEHRFANGKPELLPELATEMVRLKVDVIVTGLNEQTAAAKRATITIPIVIGTASISGQLRSERLGNGTDRTYTLIYTGMDKAGNSATCHTTVTVPHDQSK